MKYEHQVSECIYSDLHKHLSYYSGEGWELVQVLCESFNNKEYTLFFKRPMKEA